MLRTRRDDSSKSFGRGIASHTSVVPFVILILTSLLLISGCSFNYQQQKSETETDRPDFILYNTAYTVSRAYSSPLSFTAQTALFYRDREIVILHDVEFFQHDDTGSLITEGSCDTCTINTDTNDIELLGNITVLSSHEKTTITADELFWEDDDSMLTSSSESPVTVLYEDGSEISGTGFRADLTRRSIEFSEPTEGVVHYN